MPPTATPNSQRFVTYTFTEDWPELIGAIYEYEARLRRFGRPLAADLLVRAYGQMRDELRGLAFSTAARAETILVETERKSRVRPDTGGAGGPRLEDHLVAEAIDQQWMPGAVGIADEEVLDAGVPWWITNEVGSTGRVGGRLFGYFQGGDETAPPEAGMFREHPLFFPGVSEEGYAGSAVIHNPIPARHFIRDAAPVIEAEWRAGFQAIKDRFNAELTRVEATLD